MAKMAANQKHGAGSTTICGPMNLYKRQLQILGITDSTDFALLKAIRFGLPATTIDRLIRIGLDKQVLLRSLGAPASLRRRIRCNSTLTLAESDRAARIAGLVALAEDVFGSKGKAMSWLHRPSTILGAPTAPVCQAATGLGAKLVEEHLERIRHGMFA